jgi:Concanavalin A-like lectin/glucanases superfamily
MTNDHFARRSPNTSKPHRPHSSKTDRGNETVPRTVRRLIPWPRCLEVLPSLWLLGSPNSPDCCPNSSPRLHDFSTRTAQLRQQSVQIVNDFHPIAGPFITDTNLHHVAVAKSGSGVVFYVDGVGYPFPVPAFSVTFQFTTSAAIGVRSDLLNGGDNSSFCGTVDEVSFYNRPLLADEIAAIYAAGSAGKCRAGASSSLAMDRNGGISVEGTVGAAYRIECVPDLNDTNWTTFTNFVLPQSPYRILDPDAPPWSSRFYRVEGGAK